MARLRRLWRTASNYVRHDLREIIAPSSLPDPPGYVTPPKTPLLNYLKNARKVYSAYLDTWDSKKLRATLEARHGEDPFEKEADATRQELKSLMDEFGTAARGGATALKPFLQNLWNTRAVAYREAVQQFIAGYKEGFQEANKPDIPPELAQEAQAAQKAAEDEHKQQPSPLQAVQKATEDIGPEQQLLAPQPTAGNAQVQQPAEPPKQPQQQPPQHGPQYQ